MNLDAYERLKRADYVALAETVASILMAAVRAEPDLRIQQVQHRAKDPGSLRKKLEERGLLETTMLEADIKDLAGCRLVFYTNSDVSRFLSSGVVHDSFAVDWDRTKIHYPRPGSDEASDLFISHNYVVTLKEDRCALPEYRRFRDMWCEVQVQTILNRAWSEMAHDTIYKKPVLTGFGGNLFQGIERRMQTIMRDFLFPAGYEFQKVLDDFERLSAGKELFDQGALDALLACTDNNTRYDLLQRFREYVLPYYDDVRAVYPSIRRHLIATVEQARSTATRPIETPFGALPGHTIEQIVDISADILDDLRYVDVRATFDALCELFPGASSVLERERLLQLAQRLSRHELDVWKQAGPIVQSIVVEKIQDLDVESHYPLRPVLLTVLGEVLKSEVSGESSTYDSITFHRGAVHMSEALMRIRADAIGVLEELFRKADTDADRRETIEALAAATATPHVGDYSDALLKTVLDNSREIIKFYREIASRLSYEILQRLERDLLRLYRRNRDTPAGIAAVPDIADVRDRLTTSILAFRDSINKSRGFVIYKTLVGFDPVFPPAWDGEDFGIRQQGKLYRQQQIDQLVEEVTAEHADDWLMVLERCAATNSDDMATFPMFGRFLEQLSEAKPEIVLRYLDALDESLARYLPSMLHSLSRSSRKEDARETMARWVNERRHLPEMAWYLRVAKDFDAELFRKIFDEC